MAGCTNHAVRTGKSFAGREIVGRSGQAPYKVKPSAAPDPGALQILFRPFASLRVPLREARFFGGRRATRICRLARPVPLPYWAITNDTGRVNVPVWSGANFQLLRTQRAAALARIGGPDAGSAETIFPAET